MKFVTTGIAVAALGITCIEAWRCCKLEDRCSRLEYALGERSLREAENKMTAYKAEAGGIRHFGFGHKLSETFYGDTWTEQELDDIERFGGVVVEEKEEKETFDEESFEDGSEETEGED